MQKYQQVSQQKSMHIKISMKTQNYRNIKLLKLDRIHFEVALLSPNVGATHISETSQMMTAAILEKLTQPEFSST